MDLNYINGDVLPSAFRLLNSTPYPRNYDSPEARIVLLSIGLQESRFRFRKQIRGPAKSFWQFENGGGVKGVLKHSSSKNEIARIINFLEINPLDVHTAMQWNDTLAAVMARLLLYTDPRPLPKIGDVNGAWDLYIRCWRPGHPHRETWDKFHEQAVKEVTLTKGK